jgi:hypothetical protein
VALLYCHHVTVRRKAAALRDYDLAHVRVGSDSVIRRCRLDVRFARKRTELLYEYTPQNVLSVSLKVVKATTRLEDAGASPRSAVPLTFGGAGGYVFAPAGDFPHARDRARSIEEIREAPSILEPRFHRGRTLRDTFFPRPLRPGGPNPETRISGGVRSPLRLGTAKWGFSSPLVGRGGTPQKTNGTQ